MTRRRWTIAIAVFLVVGFAIPVWLSAHGRSQEIHSGPVEPAVTQP